MTSPQNVHWMPRVVRDIEGCVTFIAKQPWGKPEDRLDDILRGLDEVTEFPKLYPVRAFRPATGLSLRRHFIAQFVIIYAYIEPDKLFPNGLVSIRAVRHRRVRNVFLGVREPHVPYGNVASGSRAPP